MPASCRRLDEVLELLHLVAAVAAGVFVVRRQVADRVVAPVVPQLLLRERRILHELVHRQQLHGGDAKPLQVLDRHRVRHPQVGAAHVRGDVRVPLGEPLHVGLVDDRLVPWRIGTTIAAPVEVRVDDDRARAVWRAVEIVLRVLRVLEMIGKDRLVPVPHAFDGLGVGIHQQLVRVAPLALLGCPWAVHAVAVALARPDLRQVDVPAERRDLRQIDAGFLAGLVEQAQFDALRGFRENGKVRPDSIERRTQRVRLARPDLHAHSD